MRITEVRVHPIEAKNRLKAYATIVFNDAFVVRDLKIISGESDLFVAMPNKKGKDGKYQDIAHPLNQEIRKMIEDVVLSEYEKVTEGHELSHSAFLDETNEKITIEEVA